MEKKKDVSKKNEDLRRKAEELLSKKQAADRQKETDTDNRALVHELQVHQIELEMQNNELRRVQQELEASWNKFVDLYDFSPVGYFTIDKRGTIVDANLTGSNLFGVEKHNLINTRFQYLVKSDLRSVFNLFCERVFETNLKQACELILLNSNETTFYAYVEGVAMRDDRGAAKCCQVAVIDITEKKRMEEEHAKLREELYHAQRLESVGKLAGGVAHEFNNLLTVIVGYGSFLQSALRGNDPLGIYVQRILTSAEKAADLVQGLLAFSRKQTRNPMPVKLNAIIKEVESLLLRVISEDTKLNVVLTDKDPTLLADRSQICQILINLATNARDAMPDGGVLTICTDVVETDSEFIKTLGFGEYGKYALISFSDTGVGMDKKISERIFEPFFTTKEVGKGTGLGLAIVYGLVRQHDGYINVYSEPGTGTTFKIYLPVVEGKVEDIIKPDILQTAANKGKKTILIAEDETEVRNISRLLLEREGYRVIEAVDGEDAVRKFEENKNEISLLILDVMMLGMNGKMACDEIKKIMPDVKVVFMSGYSESIICKSGVHKEESNFIPKPIMPAELLKKVKGALDS